MLRSGLFLDTWSTRILRHSLSLISSNSSLNRPLGSSIIHFLFCSTWVVLVWSSSTAFCWYSELFSGYNCGCISLLIVVSFLISICCCIDSFAGAVLLFNSGTLLSSSFVPSWVSLLPSSSLPSTFFVPLSLKNSKGSLMGVISKSSSSLSFVWSSLLLLLCSSSRDVSCGEESKSLLFIAVGSIPRSVSLSSSLCFLFLLDLVWIATCWDLFVVDIVTSVVSIVFAVLLPAGDSPIKIPTGTSPTSSRGKYRNVRSLDFVWQSAESSSSSLSSSSRNILWSFVLSEKVCFSPAADWDIQQDDSVFIRTWISSVSDSDREL